jgi:hypothetical protein
MLWVVSTSRDGPASEHIKLQAAGYAEDQGQKVRVSKCNYSFVYVTSQLAERPNESSGFYQFIRIPFGEGYLGRTAQPTAAPLPSRCSLPTSGDQPPSTTAHNSHQICVRVMPPENGQVMHETCRDFES